MSTPGAGGPQPPEQDPSQAGRSAGWGQQPSADPPVGWGQQPWGPPQPDQAQPPWGPPQPGQAPQPWGPPPAFGQPAGAQAFGQPPRKSRRLLPILGGVVALVVALGLLFSVVGAGDPEIGDCIEPDGTSFATVACDDDEARAKIVGTDTDMTGDAFDAADVEDLCTEVPSATAVLWWGTENDEDGKVYCAEPL